MTIDKLKNLGFSIGVELPLDNDWSRDGQQKRIKEGKPFGVPDMSQHKERIILADELGFSTAWVRDVPLYDPNFGDAAQVFEAFTYLGYLAGITNNILLGTAAIVLPLRQPWLVRKSANTMAELSSNRLILGVASGDRPSEYPLFNVDYAARGQLFREAIEVLKDESDSKLQSGQKIYPQVAQYPIYAAGLAQQSPQFIGENLDGWLAYPGTPDDHVKRVALWRSVAGDKPYVSFIHLDFVDNPDAPIERHHFGVRTGVNGLIKELNSMKAAGVDHIGLHFRRNEINIEQSMEDIAKNVLPVFHK
ncbi:MULTISPECIES: LLM class flavin-dependent oxidoreductase [Pseudoalteromonas]|uniref:LLM class flavin-dependent oxidoreductase n=1 Tax=Pseudoalteromonas TaxID=53246 RepID=UPI001C001536|nr:MULTISPECIES: LLM class flavin-dependent oxidoreductase [Pseudoalteromonas]MDN3407218.1 LLM class flavin-dependent oxidoreductase [Pseudoalteromonas sp. APC 3218]MDN3408855.1 LLM class flavin-dependent oxidoreductase [Pseudoalteromonas sp. APC 3894]MDN3416260.1 LLM class flavin-dependent oxidoreductase [Pseudoalteromonas sp. APC 3227]MDN3419958.1 LLM class flavin-dependent oxidoreductase [Pseudoalteromonas sp. APC 3895]MDN3423532.1 LLM class flavin-dependent oxidoreductase [Pseudoalteromona|tara:strand:- start:10075 stop:10989 length:915 start_codon:yes stop_codon:yes gene_type:complete